MEKITLQRTDIERAINLLDEENLKNQEKNDMSISWRKNLEFFQTKYQQNIYPIIKNYTKNPIVYKQQTGFFPRIEDYFYTEEHYDSALLKIMGFIRNENYWFYSYNILNKILGDNNTYTNNLNKCLLNSKCFDNIGTFFPILFHKDLYTTYSYPEKLKEHMKNSNLHLVCNNTTFNNTEAKDNFRTKINKIKNILNNKCLTKEIFKIFMYAECYHDDPIYTIFLYDVDNALRNYGYNPQWRHFVCKHILYFITLAIEDSYNATEKILNFLENTTNLEITFFIDYDEKCNYLPSITVEY